MLSERKYIPNIFPSHVLKKIVHGWSLCTPQFMLYASTSLLFVSYTFTAQKLLIQNKSISSSAITLEITSPDIPDLTLIDLPGITEVAVGNQDDMICEQVLTTGISVRLFDKASP